MQGSIEKVECEPYEYTIKDTGEIIVLHHRFCYVQEEQQIVKPVYENFNPSIENFSKSGKNNIAFA